MLEHPARRKSQHPLNINWKPHLTLALQIRSQAWKERTKATQSPPLWRDLDGDLEYLTTVELSEVAGHVRGYFPPEAFTVNRAVEDWTPVPVHRTVAQLNAGQVREYAYVGECYHSIEGIPKYGYPS